MMNDIETFTFNIQNEMILHGYNCFKYAANMRSLMMRNLYTIIYMCHFYVIENQINTIQYNVIHQCVFMCDTDVKKEMERCICHVGIFHIFFFVRSHLYKIYA